MKKIGQWIAGLQIWIRKTFDKGFASLLKLAPIAVEATEALKKFLDSPVDDLILAILNIQGSTQLRDKLQQEWLPKIAIRLSLLYALQNQSGTPEELLRNVQAKLNELRWNGIPMGPEWAKIASEILAVIADGKVTLNELNIATQLIHYELYVKNKPTT